MNSVVRRIVLVIESTLFQVAVSFGRCVIKPEVRIMAH